MEAALTAGRSRRRSSGVSWWDTIKSIGTNTFQRRTGNIRPAGAGPTSTVPVKFSHACDPDLISEQPKVASPFHQRWRADQIDGKAKHTHEATSRASPDACHYHWQPGCAQSQKGEIPSWPEENPSRFQYSQPHETLDWRVIVSLDSTLEAGTATVSTMTDPASLAHLCHSRLQTGPTHTDSARILFRVLQAAAQCCLELQQRYAAGTAQAVQLSHCQLELMPTLQAYESALRSRHADLLRAIAEGSQVAAMRAPRGPDGRVPAGRAAAATEIPHLRTAVAARQHAMLAALAAARHAGRHIAQPTWKRPKTVPLDWRAICNLDVSRLRDLPGASGRADAGKAGLRPGPTLALHPEDTPALLQAALAATACGHLDGPASELPTRSMRLAANAPRGAVTRLLEVAQAALQWGRWHMQLHGAAWRRAWAAAQAALHGSESCAGEVARLEQAVADAQQEVWRLPVGGGGPPRGRSEGRDLHLLRAQLRNVRCVNGPHGVPGAFYTPPGLQLPCSLLAEGRGGGAAVQAQAHDSIQAERWHAIKQSSLQTEATLLQIGELRTRHRASRDAVGGVE